MPLTETIDETTCLARPPQHRPAVHCDVCAFMPVCRPSEQTRRRTEAEFAARHNLSPLR